MHLSYRVTFLHKEIFVFKSFVLLFILSFSIRCSAASTVQYLFQPNHTPESVVLIVKKYNGLKQCVASNPCLTAEIPKEDEQIVPKPTSDLDQKNRRQDDYPIHERVPREKIPLHKHFMPDTTGSSSAFDGRPLNFDLLNLTDEQKEKIQQLRNRNATKAREIRKTLRENRMQMRDMMFDPNVSDQEITSKCKEIHKIREQAEEIMLSDFLAIKAILTPEQRIHFPELKPKLHLLPRSSSFQTDNMNLPAKKSLRDLKDRKMYERKTDKTNQE